MYAYTVGVGVSSLFFFVWCPIDFDQANSHSIVF